MTDKNTKPKTKKSVAKTAKDGAPKIAKDEAAPEVAPKITSEIVSETEEKSHEEKSVRYYEAVGRRKRAVARVRLWTVRPSDSAAEGNFIINSKPHKTYFPSERAQNEAEAAFKKLKAFNRFRVSVAVGGGGVQAQAEAVRHGASRALIKFDPNFRKKLKKAGYLRRDSREVERKKPGLKKARRAPQWTKR